MTQRLDISQYFTRRQSDARYLRRPDPALAPAGVTFVGTGLSTSTDPTQFAYLQCTIVDPTPPSDFTGSQYVSNYQFTCTATIAGNQVTTVIILPWDNTGNYLIQPLVTATSYTVMVQTVDYLSQVSTGSLSFTATTAVDTTPPTPPTIVGNVVLLGLQITLDALITAADFDHYDVMRGNGYNGTIWNLGPNRVVSLKNSDIPGEVFVDHSIPLTATDYYYFLRCWDVSGNFADSNIIGPFSLTVTADPPPLEPDLVGPPAATGASNVDGSITITWLADTSDTSPNLIGYRIYRKLHGTSFFLLLATVAAGPAVPASLAIVPFTDSLTTNGYTYDYTISAIDSFGSESAYDTVNLITVTSANTLTPALPGSDISFFGVTGGISVTWSIAAGAVEYGLSWRYAQAGSISLTPWSDEISVVSNSFVIYRLLYPTTELPPTRDQLANEFEVRIRSFSATGVSSAGYVSKIITYPELAGYQPADTSIPPSPASVGDVINSDGTIRLFWDAPGISDLNGYQVEKLENETLPWNLLAYVQDDTSGTKYFLATGLEPYQFSSRTYRFRIRTKDNSGNLSNYNYVLNPGFESGLTGWSHGGSGTTVTVGTPVFSGSAALKQDDTGHVYQTMAVIAGLSYSFSAYVQQDPTFPGTYASLHLKWLDISNAVLGDIWSTNLPTTSNYQRRSISGAAPTNAVSAVIELRNDQLNPNRTAYWDAVQFEDGFQATPYGDGKTGILQAVDNVGPQDYSPLNLTATGALGQIGLTWLNPARAFSGYYDYLNGVFEIWRKVTVSLDPGLPVDASFKKIAEIPSFADGANNGYADLAPNEAYNVTAQYQLRARDRFGNEGPILNGGASVSSMSLTPNDINIITVDTVPPSQPDMITATILGQDDGSIKLTWNNQSTIDLAGYNIYRRRSAVGETFLPVAQIKYGPGGGTVSYVDANPVLLQTYDYTVSAFDRQQNESTYDTVNFKTLQSTDTRTPAVPTSLTAKGGFGGIVCNWVPSATVGVKDYGFSYSLNNGTTWTSDVTITGSNYFQTFSNAEDLSNFLFRVRADSLSHSSMSAYATLLAGNRDLSSYIPVDTTPPNPPTSFAASPQPNGDVTLTWTLSTSSDVDHYSIESQYDVSGPWRSTATVPSTMNTFRVTGLALTSVTGKQYDFRITAFDHASLASTQVTSGFVSPYVAATAPAVPTGLAGTLYNDTGLTTSTATFTWTANSESNLAGYYFLYRKHDLSDQPTIVTTPVNAAFATIHNLLQGVAYDFQVAAYNTAQQSSAYSTAVTKTSTTAPGTLIPPPTPTLSASNCYLTSTQDGVIVDMAGYSMGSNSGTFVDIEIYEKPGTGTFGGTDPWGAGNPAPGDLAHTLTSPSSWTDSIGQGSTFFNYWFCVRVKGSLSSPNTFSSYSNHFKVGIPKDFSGGGPP